jgi:hypothetical protein
MAMKLQPGPKKRSEFKRDLCLEMGVGVLLGSVLACRPVVTIGWSEILLIGGLFFVVIGIPLFRLYRKWVAFQLENEQEDDQ